MSAPVFAALPGVTEFKMAPEKIPDAELSELLRERVAGADVIAIGETVHGSSALLKLQARHPLPSCRARLTVDRLQASGSS